MHAPLQRSLVALPGSYDGESKKKCVLTRQCMLCVWERGVKAMQICTYYMAHDFDYIALYCTCFTL